MGKSTEKIYNKITLFRHATFFILVALRIPITQQIVRVAKTDAHKRRARGGGRFGRGFCRGQSSLSSHICEERDVFTRASASAGCCIPSPGRQQPSPPRPPPPSRLRSSRLFRIRITFACHSDNRHNTREPWLRSFQRQSSHQPRVMAAAVGDSGASAAAAAASRRSTHAPPFHRQHPRHHPRLFALFHPPPYPPPPPPPPPSLRHPVTCRRACPSPRNSSEDTHPPPPPPSRRFRGRAAATLLDRVGIDSWQPRCETTSLGTTCERDTRRGVLPSNERLFIITRRKLVITGGGFKTRGVHDSQHHDYAPSLDCFSRSQPI